MKRGSRRIRAMLLVVLGGALLPLHAMADNSHLFPETGQTSSNAFYDFWLTHGQTAILGLPISPTFRWRTSDTADAVVIQVYERAVLAWHPENAPGARVQLERLGDSQLDLLRATGPGIRSGAILRAFPPDPCNDPERCALFAATNHTLQGPFFDFWNARGGLGLFGYPLTEQFAVVDAATGETVIEQQFERSRFEYHASADDGTMLLGLLGTAFWNQRRDAVLAHPETFVIVPDADSTAASLPASP